MACLILFLGLLYISSALGKFRHQYVIGGQPADIQDFPFQVCINVVSSSDQKKYIHQCGGTIVTEKFIITAAHCMCLHPRPPIINESTVFAGSSRLSGKGQTYHIEHMICHRGFNMVQLLHDIGIIGVKNKIRFSRFVKPASIVSNDIPDGTMLTVTGWGVVLPFDQVPSNTLQMINVRLLNLKYCQKTLNIKQPVEDSQICTFLKINTGSCLGDSGGPVSLNGMLVGIVSYSTDMCGGGLPDVHTKVSKYISWIKTTINKYCKTNSCSQRQLYPKFQKY